MRYFNKETKTEAVRNVHFKTVDGKISDGNIVALDEGNAFFQPLEAGYKVKYVDGLPVSAIKITGYKATVTANKLNALYLAAIGYQNAVIDINLSNEIQKSESVVESGVLLEADLPMAKACGDWVGALWLDYYTRKALLESDADYTTDFSNNGVAPHTFSEVRAERKAALSA